MPSCTLQFLWLALLSALFCCAPTPGMAKLLTEAFASLFLISLAAGTARNAEAI